MASDKKWIKYYGKIADKILALEPQMKSLKDEDFKIKTEEFKQRIADGEDVDDLLIEAYAVVREAANRVLGLNTYRVQLIGAIILNSGDIAEMRTGEGKTLTGLFPAYLNALTGKGVHIVTVNEYLSQRDSEINGQVYDLLGITVGLNGANLPKYMKKDAYAQDVTYTTNSELGFDYLRDNMAQDADAKVQRGLNFAIIDEADSVLIDEARTPLIISGGYSDRKNLYEIANTFSTTVKLKEDLEIDLESKQVFLTEQGMQKAKEYFSLDNLFDVNNTELFHLIMNALKAQFTFKEGVEYTVRDNEIVLIDQFTGRIMEGRAYSDGLQQALQAKEGVEVEEETTTLATITYQNFYRLYAKLSGMTGTAKTEEEEFIKIYNTRVICTPTNRPLIRIDENDFTFGTKHAALKKLVQDVKTVHEVGNPILIGTTSVESSEQISRYLEKANLKFEMINAKNHAREAEIVAKAGQKGAITLSTNMAGRGTDIKLAEEVKHLGGLYVFGVERNEARRIDNQLRGRSGRQGDPGKSKFYISMEDDMMVRFTTPKLRERLKSLGDDHIDSRMFTRSVTNAQKKLEGMNFDQRKDVLDYDNILAQQREAMYAQRDEILFATDQKPVIKKFQITTAYELIVKNSRIVRGEKTIDTKQLLKSIDGKFVATGVFKASDFENKEYLILAKEIAEEMMKFYKNRIADVPEDVVLQMERQNILASFDDYWTKHINIASKLRSGIYLQQYAQNNPLAEYIEQATTLFNKTKVSIAFEVVDKLSRIVIREDVERDEEPEQIQISDQDINEILAANNMTNENLNREDIHNIFSQLMEANKDNPEMQKQIATHHDILLGLVIELERRGANANPNKQEIEINQAQVEEMAKHLGIADFNKMTVEEVEECFEKLMSEEKPADEQIIMQLHFAKEILVNVAKEMAIIRSSEAVNKKAKPKPIKVKTLTKTEEKEEVISKTRIG
ncbi:preprotein translocase subunit SecA [Williamsoniiplasma luminosum]|uniref:Protein translocase subunit SecA n=1 Tax=Williamsoniiplasma luminosum TaxID=214888 RepID=A0A2K8NUH4_9MOLU|nr:preprotein translocase subunit SecA [Williamsoniiplasma luminosum]ATZ16818.1 preprotein translocase subunit SecA [Williamsoniiplasma luminosum]